ncbi:alkyl sulfatase C-terminal domain-containing protein, partial [Mycolicibacterium sp.]
DEASAHVTIRLANKLRLLTLAAGDTTSPGLEIAGDAEVLTALVSVLDKPDPSFNIITP